MPHIHELIDWTTGVYIVHNNEVLIRLHDKYNMWIHVGGHIELDEDPAAAAIRECKEEVGLDVKIYDPNESNRPTEPHMKHLPAPAHMNIHYVGDTKHQHIDLIYYASSETDVVTPENDTDQWVWLSKEEIENHSEITPVIKSYALGALAALGK